MPTEPVTVPVVDPDTLKPIDTVVLPASLPVVDPYKTDPEPPGEPLPLKRAA